MSHILLEDIGKSFGAQTVLARCGLLVPRGTVATLLGPSGCGRTTPFHALHHRHLLALQPTKGVQSGGAGPAIAGRLPADYPAGLVVALTDSGHLCDTLRRKAAVAPALV